MPEGALTSFTVCDAYRHSCWRHRSCTEYFIPTDNNIVMLNFMKK